MTAKLVHPVDPAISVHPRLGDTEKLRVLAASRGTSVAAVLRDAVHGHLRRASARAHAGAHRVPRQPRVHRFEDLPLIGIDETRLEEHSQILGRLETWLDRQAQPTAEDERPTKLVGPRQGRRRPPSDRPKLRDLASAIVGLRASLRARAPRLAAIAARLRELEPGLDWEANELDQHSAEMASGVDAIARFADGPSRRRGTWPRRPR